MLDRLIDLARNAMSLRNLDPGVPVVDANELADRLEQGKPVVAMFYADWCGFCARFMPAFRGNAGELPAKAVAVDISSNSNPLWDAFAISAVPTLIAFDEGQEVARADAIPGLGLTKGHLEDLRQQLT